MGVKIITEGAVTELRLDWPEVRNAFGAEEGRELREAIEAAANTANAIVISAEGACFCAGGNLKMLVDMIEGGGDSLRTMIYGEFHQLMRVIAACETVVITAVDGPAIGFGCDLALASDVTFVGEKGRLIQGWMAAGVIPATGGIHYVQRRAGTQAVWKFLADQKFDGPAAEAMGLAIAAPDAREAALSMARKFAACSRPALQAMKRLARHRTLEDYLPAALEEQLTLFADPDFPRRAAVMLGRAQV